MARSCLGEEKRGLLSHSFPGSLHDLFLIRRRIEVSTGSPFGTQIPQQPTLSGGALFHNLIRMTVEVESPEAKLAVSVDKGFSGPSRFVG